MNLKILKQVKNLNTITTTYVCPCGNGYIEEEDDYTSGHRDKFVFLNCRQCEKEYFIDYGKSELKWKLNKYTDKNTKGGENSMNIIDSFMQVYMFELEKYLETRKEDLKNVSYQSDEANTDRPLKEFLKNLIETNFNSIPKHTVINSIRSEDDSEINISMLMKIKINRVLLPEEITEDIKKWIKESKNAIYTNPDLCLEIIDSEKIYYETIELKSTKKDAIPGSSIQQILPNEWVIFIKHAKNNISVTTGQYIHAVNSKMQFPDRRPRPQVSFQEMKKWNAQNRVLSYQSLIYKKDLEENTKYELIDDWQNVLAQRWIDILFNSKNIRSNEPWFNTTMRKFIILFLDKYDSLSISEKERFKKNINDLI